jgi:hypothetical protein
MIEFIIAICTAEMIAPNRWRQAYLKLVEVNPCFFSEGRQALDF